MKEGRAIVFCRCWTRARRSVSLIGGGGRRGAREVVEAGSGVPGLVELGERRADESEGSARIEVPCMRMGRVEELEAEN